MGPARLSQPDLLQRGRQGRSLRGVGAAGALQCRAPRRVPIAALIDLKHSARALLRDSSASAATSIGIRKGFIDENKQALGSRGTRHRNRGPDCRLCRGHEMAQPMTPQGYGFRSCTGFPLAQIASQTELASLERANEWLNSPPLTAPDAARKSRPHRFLDLYLHQLAAHASLCSRLGREIPGSRTGGDRRPRAGVLI